MIFIGDQPASIDSDAPATSGSQREAIGTTSDAPNAAPVAGLRALALAPASGAELTQLRAAASAPPVASPQWGRFGVVFGVACALVALWYVARKW